MPDPELWGRQTAELYPQKWLCSSTESGLQLIDQRGPRIFPDRKSAATHRYRKDTDFWTSARDVSP